MHFFTMALYSQALRYDWSLIHFYSILQSWRKWAPFYWIAMKIDVKDTYSFWCLSWACAFHTLDVASENADPGLCGLFQGTKFSGEKRLLFFISPIPHSHHVPLPPTTVLSPTPCCCYVSMYHSQCCPSACLVRRTPESSPPLSPPTRLALLLSEFKSRNFPPPCCFAPMNITESAKETDSWLSFQVPGQIVGCGSLQGSSAWSEVETCSGRMKNFGGSIAKMKGIS